MLNRELVVDVVEGEVHGYAAELGAFIGGNFNGEVLALLQILQRLDVLLEIVLHADGTNQ